MGKKQTIKAISIDFASATREIKSLKKQLVRSRLKAKRSLKPKFTSQIKIVDGLLAATIKANIVSKRLPKAIR